MVTPISSKYITFPKYHFWHASFYLFQIWFMYSSHSFNSITRFMTDNSGETPGYQSTSKPGCLSILSTWDLSTLIPHSSYQSSTTLPPPSPPPHNFKNAMRYSVLRMKNPLPFSPETPLYFLILALNYYIIKIFFGNDCNFLVLYSRDA